MNRNFLKKLLAGSLVLALCLSFTACGGTDEAEPDTTIVERQAAVGGEIVMPEEVVISTDNNTITNQLVGNAFVGGVTMTNYRSSRYFYIVGDSVTVTANFRLTDKNGEPVETKYTDATVVLWEKGDSKATYVETAHFVADGTTQNYTFNGLKNGGEYRIGITYSEKGMYRMSGTFSISQVSATGSEEETVADQ